MEGLSIASVASGDGRRQPAWMRHALSLWAVFVVAAAGKSIVQPDSHTVYTVFADGARHWWAAATIYQDGYLYSPLFAVFMTPFALLPNWAGGALFIAFSTALLLWALHRLVRDVLPGIWTPRNEAIFFALTLCGAARGLWSGQSNGLLFSLAALALAAFARQRWWTAALMLAAAAFIKLWVLPLVALLILVRPRQMFGRIAAAGGVMLALPFLAHWPSVVAQQYADWWQTLLARDSMRLPGQRDLWTVWETLVGPVDGRIYLAAQVLGAAAFLLGGLWAASQLRCRKQGLAVILGGWVAWQLTLGLVPERLTYLIMAPLASWAALSAQAAGRRRALAWSAWLFTGLLGTGGFERALAPYLPAASIILPLGACLFVLWLAMEAWAANRSVAFGAAAANRQASRSSSPKSQAPQPATFIYFFRGTRTSARGWDLPSRRTRQANACGERLGRIPDGVADLTDGVECVEIGGTSRTAAESIG